MCISKKTAHSSKQSMYTVELVTNHYPQGIVEWPLETGWPLYTGSSELGFFFRINWLINAKKNCSKIFNI